MLAVKSVYDAFRLHASTPLSDVDFSVKYPEAWEVVTDIENSVLDV